MNLLPFPQSRSGIFVSLVLVALFYFIYYCVFYQQAEDFYINEYLPIAVDSNTLPSGINIVLRIPKYTSSAIQGWVYGSVENTSDDEKFINLSFTLKDEDVILIPSSYQNETVFQRKLSDLDILPHSTSYFRLPWSNNILNNDAILFYVNSQQASLKSSAKSVEPDLYNALRRAVVENLFMPPWANTILPILTLVLCYLAENENEFTDKVDDPLNIKAIVDIFLHSVRGFSLLCIFVCLYMYTGKEFFISILGCSLIILFFLWRRSHSLVAHSSKHKP